MGVNPPPPPPPSWGESKILLGDFFLLCEGNRTRRDFDDSELFAKLNAASCEYTKHQLKSSIFSVFGESLKSRKSFPVNVELFFISFIFQLIHLLLLDPCC